MKLFDNLQTKRQFGTISYYNVGNVIELKKEGKYTSPLEVCLEKRKTLDYTIKNESEGRNNIVYSAFSNLKLEYLNDNWKVNNNLFEIIPINTPFKFYLDIDKAFESVENNNEILKLIKEVIEDTLNIDFKLSSICYGKGNKDDYVKVSWHIVFNNGLYFRNMDDCNIYINYLKNVIMKDDKYQLLQNGVLDFNPYKKNQAFKLPYQSKAFKNIIQIPLNNDSLISDFLVTYREDEIQYYCVDKYKSLMENISTKKKQIKRANGKTTNLNFKDAEIIQEYKNSFEYNFKLEKIENHKDELEFLLNSIPNNKNVTSKIWKIIGFCISRVTNNSERGLELWTDWTCKYKKINKEQLRDIYLNHKVDVGYGLKMLYNLGSIYNKYIDDNTYFLKPLFDDNPTFQCKKEIINERYISDNFDIKKTLKENDILSIKSPMGTGKSYSLKQVFNEYQNILYLSCKRAFATSMKQDFEEYGFKSYLDIADKTTIKKYNKIICSVESALYLRDSYDLVIIDESESICDNLTGEMIRNNKPIENISNLYKIFKYSNKLLLMDAYLTIRSFNMIKDICDDDINNKKCFYLCNEYKYDERFYYELTDKKIGNAILQSLKNNKRCVFVCGSKRLSIEVENICKEYNILSYTSSNPLPNGANVNELWKKCQLLIYTPTITAGISYDNKDFQFDNLFMYLVNVNSAHVRDMIQSHKRVRNFKDNKIGIVINTCNIYNYDMSPTTIQGVEELEYKFKIKLFEENVDTFKNVSNLNWIYNINIFNKLEINISTLYLEKLLKKYLEIENITKYENPEDFEISNSTFDNISYYDDIKNISIEKHKQIQDKINNKSIDTPNISNIEIQELLKYNFINKHIKENVSIEVQKDFFNEFYIDNNIKKKNNSVRSFKQMLWDVKYNINGFNDWKNDKKYIDTGNPFEMLDIKYMRYEHLLFFMDKLKIIENKTLNINVEFTGDDLEQFIPKYKDIDIKTINCMLKEQYIRRNLKKDTIIGSKQINTIFNNLLKEEFQMEIKKTRTQKKRIGKSIKTITYYSIINYFETVSNKLTSNEKQKQENIYEKMRNPEYNKFNVYRDYFSEEKVTYDFKNATSDYESD